MNGLSLATCDRAFGPDGNAPAWVHLFPDGKMTGRDGRQFDLADPAAVVLAFQSSGIDLPIDYEHQNDRPEAKLQGPVPAAGWIKELKAEASGLWGRVEWTAMAREMIGRKEYRYISPSFLFHPKTTQIVRLKGAGLVHNPNLHLTALAAETPSPLAVDTDKPSGEAGGLQQELAQMLGLGESATKEQVAQALEMVLSAVMRLIGGTTAHNPAPSQTAHPEAALQSAQTAVPDPSRYMPTEAFATMAQQHGQAMEDLRLHRIEGKIAKACAEGFVTHGMRDWARALCHSDEAAFDAYCTGVPNFGYLLKSSGAVPAYSAKEVVGDPVAEAICAQLGLKPGSLND